eukprot:2317315-Rhodomonas_salina.1
MLVGGGGERRRSRVEKTTGATQRGIRCGSQVSSLLYSLAQEHCVASGEVSAHCSPPDHALFSSFSTLSPPTYRIFARSDRESMRPTTVEIKAKASLNVAASPYVT